jgi:hypothetical protein
LHFVITTRSVIESGTANGVNLIEENEASFFGAGHLEKFTNHTSTLTDIFLNLLNPQKMDVLNIQSIYTLWTQTLFFVAKDNYRKS